MYLFTNQEFSESGLRKECGRSGIKASLVDFKHSRLSDVAARALLCNFAGGHYAIDV